MRHAFGQLVPEEEYRTIDTRESAQVQCGLAAPDANVAVLALDGGGNRRASQGNGRAVAGSSHVVVEPVAASRAAEGHVAVAGHHEVDRVVHGQVAPVAVGVVERDDLSGVAVRAVEEGPLVLGVHAFALQFDERWIEPKCSDVLAKRGPVRRTVESSDPRSHDAFGGLGPRMRTVVVPDDVEVNASLED